jgi:hypothetical protein
MSLSKRAHESRRDARRGRRITGGRKKIDQRPLQVKIRVTARKGLIKTKQDLLDLIESTISTGNVPEGVTIHWIDWKKGTGSKANEGHITDEIAKELEAFWLAVSHEDTKTTLQRGGSARRKLRAERVSED